MIFFLILDNELVNSLCQGMSVVIFQEQKSMISDERDDLMVTS